MLVYDCNLDNQHKVVRKFTRRWFGPYVVTSANDNGTYHLSELDGTRLTVPVARKWIKVFKKRHEDDPDPRSDNDNGQSAADDNSENDE